MVLAWHVCLTRAQGVHHHQPPSITPDGIHLIKELILYQAPRHIVADAHADVEPLILISIAPRWEVLQTKVSFSRPACLHVTSVVCLIRNPTPALMLTLPRSPYHLLKITRYN